MEHKFKIKGPIFIGRSYEEYLKMFNLDLQKLRDKKILDCAAGASSFTARMTENGYDAKAADILYDKEPSFLQNRCREHLTVLVEALADLEGHFVWDFFKDLDDLKQHRMNSCIEFYEDYKNNRANYIKADLLNIPFKNNSFSLVLCSHLLFIYDHRLNYDFHINSVKEMLRVTKNEVFVYPLVKHKSIKSEFVKRIEQDLDKNANIMIEKVDYEFRRGGNEMMKLQKLD
ncbi:class I SAM-dependent methyltransferase [Methanobacterium sp. ACI-7]|uniref:class I SAM-dependent methyltransferase n=1 Tax=unclassified Methanobacterium TaxID=2627676 RepID=UPI0039C25B0E